MKKVILMFAIVIGMSQITTAQFEIGGGAAFGGAIAPEVKANFGITEDISLSPYVDIYLGDGNTSLGLNFDGHYNFEISDDFTVYPLLGLNYWMAMGDGTTYSSRSVGLNAGGGATYNISDSMKLYGELKFAGYGVGLSAGVLFSL